jgi:hypothetical protein
VAIGKVSGVSVIVDEEKLISVVEWREGKERLECYLGIAA